MNQGIPNPLRKALARQPAGDVHPSPDVLTSFMERSLPPVETEGVTHHLAQCAECREIVFLASEAAEDEVPSRELVAAAAAARAAATPVYATHALAETARAKTSGSRWTIRTRWAVALTGAALLISSGLALRYWRASNGYQAATATVASNRPAPVSPQMGQPAATPGPQVGAAKPSAPQPLAKTVPHPIPEGRAKSPAGTIVAGDAANQPALPPAPQPAEQAAASPAAGAAVGGASDAFAPEVSRQDSLTQNETAQKKTLGARNETAASSLQLKQRPAVSFGKAGTSTHSVSAVRPQWRIGPNGQLERSLAENQWTRVLDDQSVTFHAVAVVANHVWAGGNDGALFHSSDGGERWSKVSLAANSVVENGAIVSIRFDDPQRGIVTTDSGTHWATADGGLAWTKQ